MRTKLDPSMRRQAILDYLTEHPLSSSREISDGLLEETGGAPAIFTGALYIPAWKVYADLAALEQGGRVHGWRNPSKRAIGWQVAGE